MHLISFCLVILICFTISTAQITEERIQSIEYRLGELEESVRLLKGLNECLNGWKKWNGHCYFISNDTLTWDQSKQRCTKHSSHLVKIENSDESSMLVFEANKSGDKNYWIGANDIAKEGRWIWESDGTTVSYFNWAPGEPNDRSGAENCAHLYGIFKHKWNDSACGNKWNYICEKKM